MLVSVIVPVYNVENYLERCLQSITDQTYKELEIILVNDGSTDHSGIMCDDFAKKDKRAKVIHKENGGLSSARNVGTAIAIGGFITFLDSDDYWAYNYIERSVELCVKYDADISIMDMLYIQEGVNEEKKDDRKICEQVLTSEEAIEASLYQILYSCCAPSKFYKAEIAKAVKFPEGRLSEDLATCHLFLSRANKVVYSNGIGYYYRQRNNSIMHEFNPRRMDALEWAKGIKDYCELHYPRIRRAAECRLFNVGMHLSLEFPSNGDIHDEYESQICKVIKEFRCSVITNSKARKRERIAAVLSFFGNKLLRFIWNSKLSVRKDR